MTTKKKSPTILAQNITEVRLKLLRSADETTSPNSSEFHAGYNQGLRVAALMIELAMNEKEPIIL